MKEQNDTLPAQKLDDKLAALMSRAKITRKDTEKLSPEEKKAFNQYVVQQFSVLTGDDRKMLAEKMDDFLTEESKSDRWEINHVNISVAISRFLSENHRMPTKTEIAKQTGLSRTTIHTHIKQYRQDPNFSELVEQMNFMTSGIMNNVIKQALNGDLKAARLYFDMTGKLKEQNNTNTVINNQNNYIQINGTVLSQQTIQQLKPEQLKQIEEILSIALPENKTH